MEIWMKFRKTIWLVLLTLVIGALACNLPQRAAAPAAAPTDAGFQAPAQTGEPETAPSEVTPAAQTTVPSAAPGAVAADQRKLTLGTTSSLVNSGLLDLLLAQFQANTGYEVKVEAGGAGRALRLGEKSVADVLLINDPGSEQKFIEDGFGKDRLSVMYSDFVILGPASDPAGIKSAASAAEAFKKIASTQANFFARSNSPDIQGAETKLWKTAGVSPEGAWYITSDQGPVGTLKLASDGNGYTLSDRATYLENKAQLQLEMLYQGDSLLRDAYHVLTVSPERSPKINYTGASALAQFLTSPEARAIIEKFGVDRFGEPIFFPPE
jgi:tungstate transport system substrate-binding protein